MTTYYNNNEDFAPEKMGADWTGPEVYELVRAEIDKQVVKAKNEVGRLTRIVKYNAQHMKEEGSDVGVGIPLYHIWRVTEDQIALQAALAQLAAVQQVWLSVHFAIGGPSVTSDTPEGVEKSRAAFKARVKTHLDQWRRGK